ncbi:flagellar motor switch protein FliM [Thiohalorhabdus methylotrophus]|uniref:Flagellar motor switch protein FliM n=1 Tax=Thiohalorhabdus methylotrophus TaxID=3242694 RepID=A0ABV4TY22_9GAMM
MAGGQILEEEEIQTLLEGLDQGSLEGGRGGALHPDEDDVAPYHFSEAEEEESPELPAFDVVAQRFERFFNDSMAGDFPVLRPSLSYQGYDLDRFGVVAEEASSPGVYVVLQTPQGKLLMSIEVEVARTMVGAVLGEEHQNLEESESEKRELTRIEQRLFLRLLQSMAQDLERAWEPLYINKIQDIRLESYIRDASIVRRDVRVFRVSYSLTLGDMECPMLLVYPLPVLDPYMDLLRGDFLAGGAEVDEEWRQEFQKEVFRAETYLSVVLGRTHMTLRELLKLEPGELLYLDSQPGDPVEVVAGEQTRWRAEAGKVDGQVAVRLLHKVDGNEDGEVAK